MTIISSNGLEAREVSGSEAFDGAGAGGPVGACAVAIVTCIEAEAGDFHEGVAFAGVDGDVFAIAR
jgi:hypothetical protein